MIKETTIPFHVYFSYWVIAWIFFYFIAHFVFNIRFKFIHPIVALIISILTKIYLIFLVFTKTDKWLTNSMIKFVIFVLGLNCVLLYLLLAYPTPFSWKQSTISFLVVFVFYYMWIRWNGETIQSIYTKTVDSIAKGKNQTPLISILSKWF